MEIKTSEQSFTEIEDGVKILRIYDQNVPILLVANKLDRDEDIIIDDERILEIVNQYELIDYIKTSAKTGYNIDMIYEKLVNEIFESEN